MSGAWRLRRPQTPAPFKPGPNEPPRRGQCLAEAAEFRFTGVDLLCGPEALRAQGGSLMEVRCAGANEVVMQEAVLSDMRQVGHIVHHCAGEWARTAAQKYWGVVGGVERGVGKRGCSRRLDGGQSEGGASARRGCCGSRAR